MATLNSKEQTETLDKEGAIATARPIESRQHTRIEKIDIFSKLVLTAAGLILSGVIGAATLSFNRHASERQMLAADQQVRHQADVLVTQRRIAAAQILVSQLPTLARARPEDRELMLQLLEIIDPDLVTRIGQTLLAAARSEPAVKEARRIVASSLVASQEALFALHMQNAQKILDFNQGHEASACREYMRAFDTLPDAVKTRLSSAIAAARQEYDNGNYRAAARAFEAALRHVSRPFPREENNP